MKKLIFILLLGCAGVSWGQTDTLYEENLRKVGDLLFKNLDSSLYGPSLLNRSFTVNPVIFDQVNGNYNQKHSLVDFLSIYQDLALSYLDSTYMLNNSTLASFIDREISQYRLSLSDTVDQQIIPFGLVYHNVSVIESDKFNDTNFKRVDTSFVLLISEDSIYSKALIKSCASIEFEEDNGFHKFSLKYVPELLSFSPGISNVALKINLGNGFENFNAQNNLIEFKLNTDTIIGYLALEFNYEGRLRKDTIEFFLKKGPKPEFSTKVNVVHSIEHNGIKLEYTISYRSCIESKLDTYKIKRPIIIFPPYRPGIQDVSFSTYLNQFNYGNVIDFLNSSGYDVIFIRASPGNAKLELAGEALIKLIEKINLEKNTNFPNESWENILIGYSMGGQVARYALKKMEYDHMTNNKAHHHTRLFIPFDSPNLGANIPMFTQFVYRDMVGQNVFAEFSYLALIDPASRGMGNCHILGCSLQEYQSNGIHVKLYTPGITNDRISFLESLNNVYNHQFTPLSDLRRTYPSFTRNIAVSVGRNDQNYNTEFGLMPGMKIYDQLASGLTFEGLQKWERRIFASKYQNNFLSFYNKMDIDMIFFLINFRNRQYGLNSGFEWDMAQGGYKNEFWDKNGEIPGVGAFSVPVGPVAILNNFGVFGNPNNQLYFRHMNFLPLVSSLHINPTIWQNNNLFFNPKAQGLMYNNFDFINFPPSNTYGYPNLGHPTNHFNITPFEAIYCDGYTYEHIKMQASVNENGYDVVYLVHKRNFIVNEIESDVVYLQNKTIGKNHVQGVPSYKYRAWYKAYTRIEIGNLVTPKTDPGDYIIEASGDITVYAGESVVLKPGFHAQNGSTFHAFIKRECAQPPMNVPDYSFFQENELTPIDESDMAESIIETIKPDNTNEKKDSTDDESKSLFEENKPNEPKSTENTRWFAVRNDDEI